MYLKNGNKIIPIIVVLIFWTVGSRYINPLFLPSPIKVSNSFVQLAKNGLLLKSIISSFTRITIATLLSCVISVPIGLLVTNYKFMHSIIIPVTGVSRFVPITAFYPLLIMWVGIGESMKITFLFLATFVYFLPSVILTIEDVNKDLIDTALTMGMSKFQLMYKVMLPYSLPNIMKNFLTMYGIGWTYVIIVEVINTQNGLGHLMHIGSARGRTDMVFVAILTILFLSYIFDNVGNFLINRTFKWKFSKVGSTESFLSHRTLINRFFK